MIIPIKHPDETRVTKSLMERYNKKLKQVYEDGIAIVEQRAITYDNAEPVWHRVAMPLGVHQMVRMKLGRAENILAQIITDKDKFFEDLQEEYLDALNYLAFAVSYLRLLQEDMVTEDASELFPDTHPTEFEGLEEAVTTGFDKGAEEGDEQVEVAVDPPKLTRKRPRRFRKAPPTGQVT